LEFALVQSLASIPLRQTRVRVRPEAIFGTPLLEQLREATVGKALEVRIDSYTDRQPTEKRTNILLN